MANEPSCCGKQMVAPRLCTARTWPVGWKKQQLLLEHNAIRNTVVERYIVNELRIPEKGRAEEVEKGKH